MENTAGVFFENISRLFASMGFHCVEKYLSHRRKNEGLLLYCPAIRRLVEVRPKGLQISLALKLINMKTFQFVQKLQF